jgi:hypothetical protein
VDALTHGIAELGELERVIELAAGNAQVRVAARPTAAPGVSLPVYAVALSRRRTCPLANLRLYMPGTGTFTRLVSCHARHTRLT